LRGPVDNVDLIPGARRHNWGVLGDRASARPCCRAQSPSLAIAVPKRGEAPAGELMFGGGPRLPRRGGPPPRSVRCAKPCADPTEAPGRRPPGNPHDLAHLRSTTRAPHRHPARRDAALHAHPWPWMVVRDPGPRHRVFAGGCRHSQHRNQRMPQVNPHPAFRRMRHQPGGDCGHRALYPCEPNPDQARRADRNAGSRRSPSPRSPNSSTSWRPEHSGATWAMIDHARYSGVVAGRTDERSP